MRRTQLFAALESHQHEQNEIPAPRLFLVRLHYFFPDSEKASHKFSEAVGDAG